MRAIVVARLICWFCVASATTKVLLAFQDININTKSAYIDAAFRRKFNNAKDNAYGGANRYASLLKSPPKKASSPYDDIIVTKSPPHRTNSYSYGSENVIGGVVANRDSLHRLRHSRYPNLDGVLNRLDKMQVTTATTRSTPTTQKSTRKNKNLEQTAIDNDLFDLNYQDENMENEDALKEDEDAMKEDDYYDWDSEENDEDEAGKAESDEKAEGDGWQAEEATEGTTSLLTQYKWMHLGTRNRVEETRRNLNYPQRSQTAMEIDLALKNILRMDREAKCKKPLPRVMPIHTFYPDMRKSYLPSCTVLHRCGEDTGCCAARGTACAPKTQTLIELYFYTTTVGLTGSVVEKLSFYNHTECTCKDKSTVNQMPLETRNSLDATDVEVSHPFRSGLSVRAAEHSPYASPQSMRRCKCPQQYSARFHHHSTYCTCDCATDNDDCTIIKKGEEHFSLKDRMCILEKKCGYPSCEYGVYMKHVGRCPRIEEKMGAFASVPAHIN